MNLVLKNNGAYAECPLVYESDVIHVLSTHTQGRLIVCRENIAGIVPKAWYRVKGSAAKIEAHLADTEVYSDSTCADIFTIQGGDEIYVHLEYASPSYPFQVYYLVVAPTIEVLRIEDVRQPKVVSAVRAGNVVTITGDSYQSLYGIAQSAMECRIQPKPYLTGGYQGERFGSAVTSASVAITASLQSETQLYAAIRYVDVEGNTSRWSSAVLIN